jgi:hypothetical protein
MRKPKQKLHYDVAVVVEPNPMFTPWQHAITKFLTYTQPVKCAYCGRTSKRHWTQLKFFRISEGFEMKLPDGKVVKANSFTLSDGKELFPPLTPVCRKHILSPQEGGAK